MLNQVMSQMLSINRRKCSLDWIRYTKKKTVKKLYERYKTVKVFYEKKEK